MEESKKGRTAKGSARGKLALPQYLAQWARSRYRVTAAGALAFQKGTPESKLLTIHTRLGSAPIKSEKDAGEERETLWVMLPRGRWAPRRVMAALTGMIRARFDLSLWRYMTQRRNMRITTGEAVWDFLSKYAIEQNERNWHAVSKRWARLKKSLEE